PGPNIGEGTSTIIIAGVTQTVRFSSLEPVLDTVAGPLTVSGTAADNAINYSQGSVAANGLVTIDNFESIEFFNKSQLPIHPGAGHDTINLNNPHTPTGLTGDCNLAAGLVTPICVNGGDAAEADVLTIHGVPGVDELLRVFPDADNVTLVASNTVPDVFFSGIGHLNVVGQSTEGDALQIDGT